MTRRGLMTIAMFCVLGTPAVTRAAVSFIYPAAKSWVGRSDYLILKLNNPQLTSVKITVNGLASDPLQIGSPEYRKAFQDFLIVQPVWDPGKNEVVVEGFKGQERLESTTSTIYFSVTKDPAAVPPEFKAIALHTPETEKLCTPCHNMNPSAAQLNKLGNENPCYGCHKRMLNSKFVHGPAGTFSCSYCHDVKGNPKYAIPRRDASLCSDCHADKTADFKKRKYLHGPIAAGMCEVCHDPHGSPYDFQLRMPVNELCLSCHEVVKQEPHVVRISTGEGHPLSGRPDPSRLASGKELSCVSCHNPHAGEVRYFFQNNNADRMQLCQLCHNK